MWGIFEEHASFVVKITLDPLNGPEWSIWSEIFPYMKCAPAVLPLLESVSLDGQSLSYLNPGSLLLISPSVYELHVSLNDWNSPYDVQELFSQACTAAPNLKQLCIDIPSWLVNLSVLQSHQHLRSITIEPSLDVKVLQPLSQITSLRHLSIILDYSADSDPPLDVPSLTTLVVKGRWGHLDDLFEHASLPRLRTLLVTAWMPDNQAKLVPQSSHCTRTIASKFPDLETLSLESHQPVITRNTTQRQRTAFMKEPIDRGDQLKGLVVPLLALRSLRNVVLDVNRTVLHYSSADVCAFAES